MADARCEYQHFDPLTLRPLNDASTRRVLEVAFRPEEFRGRTVLDIGCHTGFLSFLAAQNGALRVTSYDVTPAYVEELNAVAQRNGLPVSGAVKPFASLDPRADSADVVLFFEVIHWLVSQGHTIRDVIAKVAALTREQLLMEFPWDVTEPSIQAQTKLTREQYDASLIFKELGRYFERVSIRRFMSYFGTDGRSVRALVTAAGKKTTADLLPYLPGLTGLEVPLAWGRGRSTYLEGQPTSVVLKRLAPESAIARLEAPLLTRLLDELRARPVHALVLPLKLGGEYLRTTAHGEPSFVFEWIGPPPVGECPLPKLSLVQMLEIVATVTMELANIPEDLLHDLRDSPLCEQVTRAAFGHVLRHAASVVRLDEAEIAPWDDVADSLAESCYSHLCHGDANSSNVLVVADNDYRVVDMDNWRLGSPYTDACYVLGARGATIADVSRGLQFVSRLLGLPAPTRQDLLFGIYLTLGWLAAVAPGLEAAADQTRTLVSLRVRGLYSLMQYGQTLPLR